MTLTEIYPILKQLSTQDKNNLINFLESELNQENHSKLETNKTKNCYDLALEMQVISVTNHLPPDLSINPDYFEGFAQ
jgi:hypothetical protein